jgi:IS30 family transposase
MSSSSSSSRRVKKGPGRRPQSAKREKFMELRARGWSIRAAAREVGVSRSSATNWASGQKKYRNGVLVGFVPPLDRLTVRTISTRFLSQDERISIADLHQSGVSIRQIAQTLGRAPSTISRELRRNTTAGHGYRPFDAHQRATARRARHHRRRALTTRISAHAPIPAGTVPAVTATDRTRPPARSPAWRAPPSTIPAAHADHSPAPISS